MEYDVDAPIQLLGRGIADVTLVKLDAARDLLDHALGQVVDPDDTMAIDQEPLGQVAADETGHPCDEEGRHPIEYPAACASE